MADSKMQWNGCFIIVLELTLYILVRLYHLNVSQIMGENTRTMKREFTMNSWMLKRKKNGIPAKNYFSSVQRVLSNICCRQLNTFLHRRRFIFSIFIISKRCNFLNIKWTRLNSPNSWSTLASTGRLTSRTATQMTWRLH